MSDDYLIRHCAPTLAGIKTASLFTCPYASRKALLRTVRHWNSRLKPKGLQVLPLRTSQKKALIYLYRPSLLSADLEDVTARKILSSCGYCTDNCRKCIVTLVRKLQQETEFPHEIGLFLGYPPEDVCGFMECGPEGCKMAGCWKVYGDEEAAKKKFALYKKCQKVYWDQWMKGKDIERLAVATKAGGQIAKGRSPVPGGNPAQVK